MNENMDVSTYREVYEKILDLTMDAESFNLFEAITEEEVEKAKWFAAMLETLADVPLRRVQHIFKQKKIKFDCVEFLKQYAD